LARKARIRLSFDCWPATLYGSRFFDILLLDALYAQTPVLQKIQEAGWDVVSV
jgi:hypothetical protein